MTGDQQPSGPPTTLEQRLNIDFALQAAGLGIWEYDPVLNQVLWDQRCRALFGLSANNRMSYEQAFNYIHPDDIARVDQAARWVLNPHSDGLFDQTYRTIGVDDGKLRWVRFQGRVDLKPNGEVHHFGGIAQDVTQQMLTQLALETSRQRILNSFEHAPFAVAVLIGPELTYLMTNALYCKLVGRTADQLVGKPMTEAIPEVKGQGFVELLQQVISTGTPYEAKQTAFQIHLPDDGVKTAYFDFTYQPWQENDQVIGVMIAASDVTQQVKAQQQVEESQSQLRDVIAETPFAMGLHVGADLRIEVANDTQLNYWGRDRSVIGKSFREVLPELEGQGFFELFEQAYATGQSFQGSAAQAQLRLNGKLGTYYFDYSFKPVRNKQGQVYAVLNTAIDVTETVRAKHMVDDARQELLEANQRLSLAMDAGQLGAYTLDLATGTMDVSAQCRANYGQPDDTPFNFPELMATIIADDREWVQQAISTAVETQIIYVAEYQIVWPDDTRHWVRASGQPEYGPTGQPLRIIGVTQDITAQRLMQEELGRQVQQRTAQLQASVRDLRRSNENLQQFAYIASHDLQEPLRKIQQFGDLLKTRFADSLGGEELVYLERMQGAASRMSTLVKDLLSFSRISIEQSGDDAVDLNQVIDEVVGVLDMAIANSNAYVQVEMLPTILGDFVQLRQLFQNLISNALKFHRLDTAPHIHISSQMLETTKLPPTVKPGRLSTHYVRIDVADNGIGFDEKYLDRIFQVFQRLHGRSQYAGTGVGLAICEKVVTNHGGAITANSQQGQGATFSVYLPA